MNEVKKIEYDAKGKSLGRVASDIAKILMGKGDVDFALNKVTNSEVILKNIESVKVDNKKMTEKKYYRHSGHLGNLKESSMKNLWGSNPQQLFINILKKMLPDNKLRRDRLNKVKFVN